ncbi:hypothetical protein [Paraburkholderia domus]|uniref:hypothetical protein n=1 Tax=Paraburkholderia domus TaxID=2793075 RepID=UPI001EF01BC0|nr:hypothetical protein [Paraburkholderia domus]
MLTLLPFAAAAVNAFWIAFVLSVLPVGSALYGACVIEITPEVGVVDEAADGEDAGVEGVVDDPGRRNLFAVAVGSEPSEPPPPHAARKAHETRRADKVLTGKLTVITNL